MQIQRYARQKNSAMQRETGAPRYGVGGTLRDDGLRERCAQENVVFSLFCTAPFAKKFGEKVVTISTNFCARYITHYFCIAASQQAGWLLL
jgi:hypothetical protein